MQTLLGREPAAALAGLQATIEHDPATGGQVLKLPLPQPQTVQRLAQALGGWLDALQRGRTG